MAILLLIWLQNFPGYPVWLLATLSYLLSEDGVSGRDCIDDDGCSANCGRFVPPFNPLNPFVGGFRLVCVQKLILMITDVIIVILSHSGT